MVQLSNSGQFNGVKSFKPMAGKYLMPPHLVKEPQANSLNTTGARYYFVPFIVEQPITFAGAWCYNQGVGDNGDKAKIAAYNEASGGGPGTLAKSFGEITFTGASALRNFASSWTATPGKYYLAFVTDNAVAMQCMAQYASFSGAGQILPNPAGLTMGELATVTLSTTPAAASPTCDYVAGTYANFPEATALTPTASGAGVQSCPLFGLYT